MKKINILILLIVSILIARADNGKKGIHFFKGTFEQALQKSIKENKILFVDVYTSWCGPCKKMAKDIFTQKKIGDFFNQHFVNYKLLADNQQVFVRKFNISSYPTYIFFKNGKPVYRFIGSMTAEKFLKYAQDIVNGKDNYHNIKKWEGGKRSEELALKCLVDYKEHSIYKGMMETKKFLMNMNNCSKLFFTILKKDAFHNKSPFYNYILKNRAQFYKTVGNQVDSLILKHSYNIIEKGYASYGNALQEVERLKTKKDEYNRFLLTLASTSHLLITKDYVKWEKQAILLIKQNKYPFVVEKLLSQVFASGYFREHEAKKEVYKFFIETCLDASKTNKFYLFNAIASACYAKLKDSNNAEKYKNKCGFRLPRNIHNQLMNLLKKLYYKASS